MATRRKTTVPREPNGRQQREREFPPTQVKRLRDAAMSGLRNEEWGTELGRLYLETRITAEMYAAGKRWSETAAWYHQAIGAKPLRGAQVEVGVGSQPADPDSSEGQKQVVREAERAERFFEAHAVLLGVPGAERTVRALCEQDEGPCGFAELLATRNGLFALADYWGLTGRNKPGTGNVR